MRTNSQTINHVSKNVWQWTDVLIHTRASQGKG